MTTELKQHLRSDSPIDSLIGSHAKLLSDHLHALQERLLEPTAQKQLRRFTNGEAARLIGVSDSFLRQLSLAEGPKPDIAAGGRRLYSLEQINAFRRHLADSQAATKNRFFVPHRVPPEHMQIVAVTNFKGGSGKTTTSAHLAQYLALLGYRVLAVDLDPQASLTTLFGYQPEFDVKENESLYASIRYDDERRPLVQVIRKNYFTGLDVVPANLELHEFEHTTPKALMDAGAKPHGMFFARVGRVLASVQDRYDVVIIDCPPQLGFLTLGALCAATSVIVTIHPQMLDVASMSQFLLMTTSLLKVVREAGGDLRYDFFRYLVTRYEPNDGPQTQIAAFLRSLFGDCVLTRQMVKSTAISDAGLTKNTLYEIGRENFSRGTYDRALEALDSVNAEIENLIKRAWGRHEQQ